MAHRLTEQEHDTVLTLAKIIGKKLPAQFRSVAGGIASGLVRLRKSPLPADDVTAVLEKYGADQTALEALVDAGVLEPAGNGYALRVPQDQDAPAEKDERSIARTEPPRPPARRAARGLTGLDTVRKQTPELNDVRRQIIDLDPRLWINGWLLSTPDAFLRYERELRALDAALAGGATLGDGTLSLRELSYQLFGDEKFLAVESDGRKLLHLMGITDVVSCRPQVKLELLHHIPKHHRHLRLVVSENLDPWVNMRNALFVDGRKKLLGERVHGVVFGNGYLVDDPHKLPDLIDTLHADDVRVLYWGDVDRAGLSILAKLVDMADGRFSVEPFAPAYRKMLRRAMRRFPDPLMNEETDQGGVRVVGLELMEGVLGADEMAYLRAVVEGARLIPQEILTARDL
ncbi:Wadjet anti-phage system protein JetD domain-containing protein [Olsenella uli]|uniref:Wadjet anti-phage system protein JetD domain-containing protein n=1 Tax=Olsenella uli TaxID=133926 RepID=UPI0019567642|nr:Wadjet anti-phage system protein JetD domain-containing protein [Olsenella uli]